MPVEHKTSVLTVLEEDVSDEWLPVLSDFISTAHGLLGSAVSQVGSASYYCERLLHLLLLHVERLLPALPPESLSELRAVTRGLLASVAPNCSFRAAMLLRYIGGPEDVPLLQAHRPEDEVGAKAFEEVVQVLTGSRPG